MNEVYEMYECGGTSKQNAARPKKKCGGTWKICAAKLEAFLIRSLSLVAGCFEG